MDDAVKDFFRLVGTGQLDEVRRALDEQPRLVNEVGPHPFWGGRPQALHVAIETGQREFFDLLLDRGADVNGRNDQYDQWSPLMLTIHRNRTEMRDELLRRGARVGLPEALMLGDDARLDEVLSQMSTLPEITPNGGSLLAFARTPHAIDRLLALGASTSANDRWGTAPIAALSRLGAVGAPLVRHFTERTGITASAQDYARLGDRDALERLDPSAVTSDDVVMAAVDFRHHELVAWLLDRGASPNARTTARSRQTALHSAAWNGDARMVRLLAERGADPTLVDDEHRTTPLHWAEVALEITGNAKCRDVIDYLGPKPS